MYVHWFTISRGCPVSFPTDSHESQDGNITSGKFNRFLTTELALQFTIQLQTHALHIRDNEITWQGYIVCMLHISTGFIRRS